MCACKRRGRKGIGEGGPEATTACSLDAKPARTSPAIVSYLPAPPRRLTLGEPEAVASEVVERASELEPEPEPELEPWLWP